MALDIDMWVGPEAEGTYKGILTLFIHSAPSLDKILQTITEYPHIFFTKEFKEWAIIEIVLNSIPVLVTVETWGDDVDEIPWSILTRAHILVRVKAPWIDKLKGTDNIILGDDYRGYTYIRDAAIRSIPSDYQLDRRV